MGFDKAVELILEYEGGEVNDPNDPGGHTKYGISQRAYPEVDIEDLTIEDAKRIYRIDYWDRIKCDEMPSAIALCVFDMAVNAGNSTAVKLLQRVLRVTDDGIIGPVTLDAARNADADWIVPRYAAERIAYYSALSGWQRYGRGWSVRVVKTAMEAGKV